MPTLQERTREQLRVHVGYVLGALKELEADASGNTTTFLTDDVAILTADDPNGKWLVFTSGSNDGSIRQITNSTVSSNRVTLTFFPSVTASTADGDTAEMWDQWYDPTAIHNFINQSLLDVTGRIFDPVEDISLHTGPTFRYDIPTTLEILSDIYLRTNTRSRQVKPAGVVWDESIDSDFTVALDTEDLLYGRQATRFTIGSSVSAGNLASDDISSTDLSDFTHIEFPIKVRDAVVADELVLRLSAAANGADTDKLISIPAITAATETWVRVSMAGQSSNPFSPSLTTAIISVALEVNSKPGDGTNIVHIGEIRATRNDGDIWSILPRHLWLIDKEARDIVLIDQGSTSNGHYGSSTIDYMLMKLVGGDNPALLTSDATVTEVPESYIVYRTAGLVMRRPIRGETSESARVRISQSNDYLGMAKRAEASFPMLKNGRLVT